MDTLPRQKETTYHDVICAHLHHNGFMNGLYSDLVVRIQSTPFSPCDGLLFKLHRLMAIRSPLLAGLLKDQQSQSSASLTLSFTDPYLTREGLGLAFGHLYAAFASNLLEQEHADRSALLCSVLAASHLLQLADLALVTTEYIQRDIGLKNLAFYCQFVTSGNYGQFSTKLMDYIVDFLCTRVEQDIIAKSGLIWSNPEGESYKTLARLFALLPFDLLKTVVESVEFKVPTDMQRLFV